MQSTTLAVPRNMDSFYNTSKSGMNLSQVYDEIINFISVDPTAKFILSIGTDAQVGRYTQFITAVHLHRVGHGAWGCLKRYCDPRRILSTREKISMETSLSQELTYRFIEDEIIERIMEVLLPYANKGAELIFQVHIDVGENGPTRELIKEMVGRITGMGVQAVFKSNDPNAPYPYTASCYADRNTKF